MKRAALALFVLLGGPACANEPPKSVVELFTSQGCAACPPADKLIGELAKNESTLVLTFAVDYWDYLGWKDTLGSGANSARQRSYALARGDRKVFTPQVVVNGIAQAIGSDRVAIMMAIDESQGRDDLLSVPVDVRETANQIEVQVGEQRLASAGEVWLLALAGKRTVTIGRGENASREVTYTNVVRRMTRMGTWNGRPGRFLIGREEAIPADADRYAILVQAGSGSMPGVILGAAESGQ